MLSKLAAAAAIVVFWVVSYFFGAFFMGASSDTPVVLTIVAGCYIWLGIGLVGLVSCGIWHMVREVVK